MAETTVLIETAEGTREMVLPGPSPEIQLIDREGKDVIVRNFYRTHEVRDGKPVYRFASSRRHLG
jgi:hypothetical protein